MNSARTIASATVAFYMVVTLVACAMSYDPLTGKKSAFAYTWQQEIALGQKTDVQISEQFGVYQDRGLTDYVVKVGERVLAQSHMRGPSARTEFRETKFSFKVLDSPVINAFAVPGGYIYVTRGLMGHMCNEAQLAVIIGHEIGHVVSRHSSRKALKSKWAQLGLMAGAVVAQQVAGVRAEDVMQLGGEAAKFLFLKYSRDDERQADRLGVEYAAKAGYLAAEASEFFVTLARLAPSSGSIPSWMSTHPDPGNREKSMVTMSNSWVTKGFQQPTVGIDDFFLAVDGMSLGEDPRQGFVKNSVYYHPARKFLFPIPDGWKVMKGPEMVAMVEPGKSAQIVFQIIPEASARAAAEKTATRKDMTILERTSKSVNGLPVHVVVAKAMDKETELRIVQHFIDYNDKVYGFMSMAPTAVAERFAGAMQTTTEGFAALTDPGTLNVRAPVISVLTAGSDTEFQRLLPSPLPPGFSAESVALMNQMNATDRVTKGKKIKVPAFR
jgi:predicted Zn-dependent protease